MKASAKCLGISAATLCLAACAPAGGPAQQVPTQGARYDFGGGGRRFELPARLDEISGLAMTSDGRLFTHNDERGTVHEIDPTTGAVGKRFSLGDPPVAADFEGIAIAGDRFFLMTSGGHLYEFREGEDRASVPFRATDLGIGRECEAEGLEYDAQDDALLVGCKTTPPNDSSIVIRRIALDSARPALAPILIPKRELVRFGLEPEFRASSVAVSAAGTFFLSSAAPEAIIEIDRSGALLWARSLRRRRHPQPEGLAFGQDGSLYLADEMNDRSAGTLTRYAPVGEGGSR